MKAHSVASVHRNARRVDRDAIVPGSHGVMDTVRTGKAAAAD